MPLFEYKAFDRNGKDIKGKEEAHSQEQLKIFLERKGLIPYEIVPAKEKRALSFSKNKVSSSDVSLILYEMGILYDRGIHVTDIFEILAKQFESSNLQDLFVLARSKVAEGTLVSQAMKEMGIFPDFVIEMVFAGEESGALGKILISASKFLERESEFKEKIKGALTYPAIVLTIGFLSMIVVMKVAVPKIVKIYSQFKQDIPLSTRAIMAFSSFLTWFFYALPVIGLILFLMRKRIFTRENVDAFKLKVPFFRDIQLYSVYTSWNSTLSILLEGGLPLDAAVEVANKTVNNAVLKKRFEPMVEWIREGKKMTDYLKKYKVLPDSAVRLISIGEETGGLEEMLSLLSSIYRKETEKLIILFMNYLEPATLLVLAVFVAFFVFATILPIFNLSVR